MEDKKVIKVKLSAVVIIVLIIAIGVMTYFLCTAYNDKNDAFSTIEGLKKDIEDLKQEKTNLNMVNSNNTVSNSNKNNTNAINTNTVENKKDNEKVYTPKSISGSYKATVKADGLADDAFYSLDLYENGIYKYEYGVVAPSGTIGSYIIDGNKIILNELFATASDVSTRTIKENKTMTIVINEDGSLTDKNNVIDITDTNVKNKLNNINLKKDTNKKLNNNDINKYFDGTYFVNSYSEIR